jgi:hypothetical protein
MSTEPNSGMPINSQGMPTNQGSFSVFSTVFLPGQQTRGEVEQEETGSEDERSSLRAEVLTVFLKLEARKSL